MQPLYCALLQAVVKCHNPALNDESRRKRMTKAGLEFRSPDSQFRPQTTRLHDAAMISQESHRLSQFVPFLAGAISVT